MSETEVKEKDRMPILWEEITVRVWENHVAILYGDRILKYPFYHPWWKPVTFIEHLRAYVVKAVVEAMKDWEEFESKRRNDP